MILVIEESSTARLHWQRMTMPTDVVLEVTEGTYQGEQYITQQPSMITAVVVGTIISEDKLWFIQRIQQRITVPLIVCMEHDEDPSPIYSLGVDKVMEKPIRQQQLHKVIQAILPPDNSVATIEKSNTVESEAASSIVEHSLADKVIDLIESKIKASLLEEVRQQIKGMQETYFSSQLPTEVNAYVDKMDFGPLLMMPASEKKAMMAELESSITSLIQSEVAAAITDMKTELLTTPTTMEAEEVTFELDAALVDETMGPFDVAPSTKKKEERAEKEVISATLKQQLDAYLAQWLAEQSSQIQKEMRQADSSSHAEQQDHVTSAMKLMVNEHINHVLTEQMTIASHRMSDNERQIKALSSRVARLFTLLLVTAACVFGVAILLVV